jgi:Flp pilus assembly protein TadG
MKTTMRSKRKNSRCGAAAVELAICLPVVMLVVLSAIEGASVIFLRQTLVQGAYESVKASVKIKGTEKEAISRGNAVLTARSIEQASYKFELVPPKGSKKTIPSPLTVDNAPRGTQITVRLTAPANQNSVLPFGPFKNQLMEVSATMLKE